MRKKLLLASIILISIIISGFILFSRNKDENISIITTVRNGPFEILVYSSGQLESENSDHVYIPEGMKNQQTRISSLTITDIVEEGTYVDSGDYVATLDHMAVEEQLKTALDDLEKAWSEYEDSKIDSNLTLSNQRDLIVNASLDLEEKKISVDESIYESPSVQKKAEMDYDKARRKLAQTQNAYTLKQEQEKNKVNRKFISYKQIRERVDALEKLSGSLIIRSHRSGIISYYQQPWGGVTKTGSRVSQWSPIVATFPNMDNLVTRTFINEIDISLIKKGQKVDIGIDAFPDKKLAGEVVAVANMGQAMPNSDAKVFEVKIKVNGSDPELKPAMTTSNIIQTNYFDDVLYVPIEAVFENDSLSYVFPADKNNTKQIVETGAANENHIMIVQGLREGQELQLLEPDGQESFSYTGWDIYEDVKRKEAERKANEEVQKKKQNEEKGPELPPGVVIPNRVKTINSPN